jgi:hydroxycarboxylate dehydrogenase B
VTCSDESVVFDPAAFSGAPAFADDLAHLASWVKTSQPAVADNEVLLPGEPERRTRAQRLVDGIPLDGATRRQLSDLARGLGVALAPELAS